MSALLTMSAHPSVVHYLKVQACLSFTGAILLGGFLAILLFVPRRRRRSDWAWIMIGAAATLFALFEGVFSLMVDAPAVTLDGDRLTVGGQSVTLDDTTELSTPVAPPRGPTTDEPGYFRLPGTRRFPPFFTGGPMLRVKTRSGTAELRPLLYGPSVYFDDDIDPQATSLMQQLAARGRGGNARDWLAQTFRPVSPASIRSHPSFARFLAFWAPLTAALAGFFVWTVVAVRRSRRARPAA